MKTIYELKVAVSRINQIDLSLPYSHLVQQNKNIGAGNKKEQVNTKRTELRSLGWET